MWMQHCSIGHVEKPDVFVEDSSFRGCYAVWTGKYLRYILHPTPHRQKCCKMQPSCSLQSVSVCICVQFLINKFVSSSQRQYKNFPTRSCKHYPLCNHVDLSVGTARNIAGDLNLLQQPCDIIKSSSITLWQSQILVKKTVTISHLEFCSRL